jgi:hypothetical protein
VTTLTIVPTRSIATEGTAARSACGAHHPAPVDGAMLARAIDEAFEGLAREART